MNQSNIDSDSTESITTEEEISGSPDEMVAAGSEANLTDPETQEIDNPEEGANPAEDIVDPSKDAADENGSTADEDDSPPDETDSEPETAAEVSQPPEPMSESLTYMGMDSTAVTDIAFIEIEDERDNSVAKWISEVAEPKDGQKPDKDTAIQQGIEFVEDLTAEANLVVNKAAKNHADCAIEIGTVCIFLKELTRGSDEPWGVWASKHLPFLARRNRQKFMNLAKRADCHDFTYLGVDRLDVLCSVTKDSTEKEPIKALFEKYSISFDETVEVNMTEFRNQIDAAVSNERLIKKGLEIDFSLVANAVNAKVGFDTALINKLKVIKDNEGKPEKYVKTLTIGQGSEGSDGGGEKRLQDFNSLSARLVKTIDYIVINEDHLDSLDKDIFINLYEKINALLTASGIEIEEKPEE